MTQEFIYLMQLVGAQVQGKAPAGEPLSPIDWNRLITLAKDQSVYTTLGYILKTRQTGCPPEIAQPVINMMREYMIVNLVRYGKVFMLLKELERKGIHAVLIKGFDLAREYAVMECRMSSDVDLLVSVEEERSACDALRAYGFRIVPRWKHGHHSICFHPMIGSIELHVYLYEEIIDEVWFRGEAKLVLQVEPHVQKSTQENVYYGLGMTDNLIFIVLHMVKHFIVSGMSLQMILDVALYIQNHRDEIDFSRFEEVMESLHYRTLIHTVLWAAVRYCGFDKANIPILTQEPGETLELMLDDLESGGAFGKNDRTHREKSGFHYNRQMLKKSKNEKEYRAYMYQWEMPVLHNAVFPSKEQVAAHYPYVLDKPWLLPYAWMHRLLFRGYRYIRGGRLHKGIVDEHEAMPDITKKRIELFQSLKIM